MPELNPVSNLRPTIGLENDGTFGKNQQQNAQVAVFTYDFSKLGGGITSINLTGDVLPPNCVVFGGLMRNITIPVGVGASIALQLEAANDIISSAAINGAPWSTAGNKAIVPVWTAATAVTTTVVRNLKAVITGAALTAGKFEVILFFYPFSG